MTDSLLLVGLVVLLVLAGMAAVVVLVDWWWSRRERFRVRLHVDGGPSLEGVLMRGFGRREFVLRDSHALLAEGATPSRLDSREARIPKSRVPFYEVIDS